MTMERKVSLFRNGRSQAVRIPKDFEMPGTDVVMRKEGFRLVIEPARKRTLLDVLATLRPSPDPFPEVEDFPAEPVNF
jgi:antitoxin VapB